MKLQKKVTCLIVLIFDESDNLLFV